MKKLILILLLSISASLAKAQFCRTYTSHATISMNGGSNITISGYVIDMAAANATGILIQNARNVHITKCKIINSVNNYGIKVYKCKNVTIDSCDVENVGFGIYCQNDTSVQVNASRVYNMNGWASSATMGHGIQFDNVIGGGSCINWNFVWSPSAINAHDCISVYESSGLPGDSIMVTHNRVLDGQTFLTGGNGACGIGVADTYGSYQVVRYDTVSTSGFAGIQPIGGTSAHPCVGISVDHNVIYSPKTPISWVGLSVQIGFGSGIYVGYNKVNWTTYTGTKQNFYYSGVTPAGWSTNISDNTIPSTILRSPLWSPCLLPPVISYIGSPYNFTYGLPIASLVPINTGGVSTSYSITSGLLPAGLSFNTTTGIFSGTPTSAYSTETLSIKAINSAGNSTTTISITVNKAVLTVVPNLAWKIQGQANPVFTCTYLGFQLADNIGSVGTLATVSTSATSGSPAGNYILTASGAAASNYTFTYYTGTFIILPITIGAYINRPITVLTH